MLNSDPSKLAEARKMIENWRECRIRYKCGECFDQKKPCLPCRVDIKWIENLLAAQDLISYERGREEQRNEILKNLPPEKQTEFLVRNGFSGTKTKKDLKNVGWNQYREAIKVILNPTSDAK